MTGVHRILARIAQDLERAHMPWALVGGLAISVRVGPRFTRDVDIAVAADSDLAAEQLLFELQKLGYGVLAVLDDSDRGRLATVRLQPAGESDEGVVVDLLFGSTGIEQELCRDAERIDIFPGLTVPVCTVGHLLAMKILARDDDRRPQDLVDIRALVAAASTLELDRAREALNLVTARGANRGRDLVGLLDKALRATNYGR